MAPATDPWAALEAALARPSAPSSDYDLAPERPPARRAGLRPAGVLMALEDGPGGPRLYLTKRSPALKHHPGQIAFPGGKLDAGDADAAAAALREAREEIGLDPATVHLLAELPSHETVTGYTVTPIVARIDGAFSPIPEAGEVAEVFRVPLSLLLDPSRYRIERRRWRGVWRRYYVVPYGPYYIWGATARMLKSLADRGTS